MGVADFAVFTMRPASGFDADDPNTEWHWRCQLCGDAGTWIPASGIAMHTQRREMPGGRQLGAYVENMFRCDVLGVWVRGTHAETIAHYRMRGDEEGWRSAIAAATVELDHPDAQ